MLVWTDERPQVGWRIIRQENGSWLAEQLDGPRSLTNANLVPLIQALAGEDAALQRRYTETQVRAAAQAAQCNPDTISTQLRALTG